MKKPDRARRIHENVSAELTRIAVEASGSWRSSSEQLLRVRPPRAWTPDVPRRAEEHAVGPVDRPRLIDENGPPKARVVRVRAGLWAALERHHDRAGIEFLKRPFVLLQLQQMPAARQSTQVPMEDQQQPVPAVVLEAVEKAFRIRQREWHRGITDACALHDSSCARVTAAIATAIGAASARPASSAFCSIHRPAASTIRIASDTDESSCRSQPF